MNYEIEGKLHLLTHTVPYIQRNYTLHLKMECVFFCSDLSLHKLKLSLIVNSPGGCHIKGTLCNLGQAIPVISKICMIMLDIWLFITQIIYWILYWWHANWQLCKYLSICFPPPPWSTAGLNPASGELSWLIYCYCQYSVSIKSLQCKVSAKTA